MDIVTILKNESDGNRNAAVARKTVQAGSSSTTFSVTPRASALPGSNYRVLTYIAPKGKFFKQRFDQENTRGLSLVDDAAPVGDELISVADPASFLAGQDNTVTISYSASEARDLLLILADANDGYSWVAWKRFPVSAGEASQSFELPVPSSAPKHSNYKFEVLLVEKDGWNSQAVDSFSSAGNTVE